MPNTISLENELDSLVPDYLRTTVSRLSDDVLCPQSPLQVMLLGAFSVGKSSLLNMLLGEEWLPSSQEETTALPTMIEYGDELSLRLINVDGMENNIDKIIFSQSVVNAPDAVACAALSLPILWLKGLSIVDLPGLGSISSSNRSHTQTRIQQADAVLYLLNPRGPTREDIDVLRQVRQGGKRIKVLVARWDEVEAAVNRGEKALPLGEWAAVIEEQANLKVRLAPASRHGVGREEIIEFLQRAKEDLADIRERRFRAELKPVLENALGVNAGKQAACQVDTEQDAQAFHEKMMKHKQGLSDAKADLYNQRLREQNEIDDKAKNKIKILKDDLFDKIQTYTNSINDEAEWDNFISSGSRLLTDAVAESASFLSDLSRRYGALDLPEDSVVSLNLRLPATKAIDVNDFIDMGRLAQLEEALEHYRAEVAKAEHKLVALPDSGDGQADQQLAGLLVQRDEVMLQPITREEATPSNWKVLGRIAGEIADVGLVYFNPLTAGLKVGSLLGKVPALGQGLDVISKVSNEIQPVVQGTLKVGQDLVQNNASSPAARILGKLQKVSLSYWGEYFGSMMDDAHPKKIVVDEDARIKQTQDLAVIDEKIQAARRALDKAQDLANERQLTGWALEQSQRELKRLEQQVADQERTAEEAYQKVKVLNEEHRKKDLQRMAERAQSHWLRSFEKKTSAMIVLLMGNVKSYWDNQVDSVLQQSLNEIEMMESQSKAAAADKKASLEQLRGEALLLEQALKYLR
ncbi:dynamin family protein [Insolitispirillum peregrinum]|uniref:dynamin family protein n=1 Tax=Insolitispirillum peregrinum TaxID=80876 RepID=UPI0036094773